MGKTVWQKNNMYLFEGKKPFTRSFEPLMMETYLLPQNRITAVVLQSTSVLRFCFFSCILPRGFTEIHQPEEVSFITALKQMKYVLYYSLYPATVFICNLNVYGVITFYT